MAGCKLTRSLRNRKCQYDVAGVALLFLANWYPGVDSVEDAPVAIEGQIGYGFDADGILTSIILPPGEKFFQIDANRNVTNYTDDLVENGNGGKYRTHTVNTVIGKNDMDIQDEGDAISLGAFIAVVVDKAGVIHVLGRSGGLMATSFNYASGGAETDASGWTTVLTGTSKEIAPIVKSLSVITPIDTEIIP